MQFLVFCIDILEFHHYLLTTSLNTEIYAFKFFKPYFLGAESDPYGDTTGLERIIQTFP